MWLPEEDKYTNRKNELLASLSVSMGGRVAEEIIFGDITNGARGDIRGATAIARRMVCEWGMSEKMGMVEYGEHEDYVSSGATFLVRAITAKRRRANRPGSAQTDRRRLSIGQAHVYYESRHTRNNRKSAARVRDSRRLPNQRDHRARTAD